MPEHVAPWTKGPWRIRDEDGPPLTDVMVGDRLLATAYPDHTKHAYPEHVLSADAILRSYAEAEANARLIAAAPAQDAALNYVADMTYCGADTEWHLKKGYDPQVVLDALARARGQTNG